MRKFINLLLVVAALAGCQKPPPPPLAEVVMASRAVVPTDPDDSAWQTAPAFVAKLIPQDLVEPRLLASSTTEVAVRAIENGKRVALRLEWLDATTNNTPGPAMFSDGCAVQFPASDGPFVPAPQMGEPGKPVEIVFWTANWQAIVDGRPDNIKALYPRAQIDHYPFEAASLKKGSEGQREMQARYSPARARGNNRGGPRTVAVEDYIAEGPGTISPNPKIHSTGAGKRTPTGWAVVLVRPLAASRQVAFAVWEGAREEVGARKMRTAWIPISKEVKP